MGYSLPVNLRKTASRDIQSYYLHEKTSRDFYIPASYGIIEISAKDNSFPSVVLIKDAHCNYEAQKNIANILKVLINQYKVSLVAVEGAKDIVDVRNFSNFQDEELKSRVIDKFVQEGYMTGPELLKIVKNKKISFELYGVEDVDVYSKNFSVMKEAIKDMKRIEVSVSELKNIVDNLKNKFFSDKLKVYDDKVRQYCENKLELTNFAGVLSGYKVDLELYSNFRCLNICQKIENKINYKEIEHERESLLRDLQARMVKEDIQELIRKSLEYKLGRTSELEYYFFLSAKVDLKRYFNLYRRFKSLKIYAKLDTAKLLMEVNQIVDFIYASLINTNEEKLLVKAGRDLNVYDKLIHLKLNPNDLEYYKNNVSKTWNKLVLDIEKLSGIKISQELYLMIPKNAEAFYEIALRRNAIMLDNFLKKKNGDESAVLIAGGFHTDAIKELLTNKGISYAVIRPNITTADKDNPYFSIIGNIGNTNLAITTLADKDNALTGKIPGAREKSIELEEVFEEACKTGIVPCDIGTLVSSTLKGDGQLDETRKQMIRGWLGKEGASLSEPLKALLQKILKDDADTIRQEFDASKGVLVSTKISINGRDRDMKVCINKDIFALLEGYYGEEAETTTYYGIGDLDKNGKILFLLFKDVGFLYGKTFMDGGKKQELVKSVKNNIYDDLSSLFYEGVDTLFIDCTESQGCLAKGEKGIVALNKSLLNTEIDDGYRNALIAAAVGAGIEDAISKEKKDINIETLENDIVLALERCSVLKFRTRLSQMYIFLKMFLHEDSGVLQGVRNLIPAEEGWEREINAGRLFMAHGQFKLDKMLGGLFDAFDLIQKEHGDITFPYDFSESMFYNNIRAVNRYFANSTVEECILNRENIRIYLESLAKELESIVQFIHSLGIEDKSIKTMNMIYYGESGNGGVKDLLQWLVKIINSELKKENFAVQELLKGISDHLVSAHIERPDTSYFDIPVLSDIKLFADKQLLTIAIARIFSNGLHLKEEKPEIKMSEAKDSVTMDIVFNFRDVNQLQKFKAIADNAENNRQIIFKMGMTARDEGQGLGLGLLWHIVRIHGGNVKADYDEDKMKAIFTITLPKKDKNIEDKTSSYPNGEGFIRNGTKSYAIFKQKCIQNKERNDLTNNYKARLLGLVEKYVLDNDLQHQIKLKIQSPDFKVYGFNSIVTDTEDYMLGEYFFDKNELFIAEDLISELEARGPPSLVNEYLIHELICPILKHYPAILCQQQLFRSHYSDQDKLKTQTDNNPYKGELGVALREFIDKKSVSVLKCEAIETDGEYENMSLYKSQRLRDDKFVSIEPVEVDLKAISFDWDGVLSRVENETERANIIALLGALQKKGIKIYILSRGEKDTIYNRMKMYGLDKYIPDENVKGMMPQGMSMTGLPTSKATILSEIRRELGIGMNEIVHLDDTASEITETKMVAVTVGIAGKNELFWEPLFKAKPNYVAFGFMNMNQIRKALNIHYKDNLMTGINDIDFESLDAEGRLKVHINFIKGLLSEEVRQKITDKATWKIEPEDSEVWGRSILIRLEEPIQIGNRKIDIIKIKGVVNDEGKTPPLMEPYIGKGRVDIDIKLDSDGKPCYEKTKYKPKGGALLKHAVHEFNMARLMERDGLRPALALGYGEYTERLFDGERTGFVIFGYEESQRMSDYLEARLNEVSKGKTDIVNDIYRKIGRTLREIHQKGYVHHFPHADNFTINSKGEVVIHDLDNCMRRCDFSDEVFIYNIIFDFVYMINQSGVQVWSLIRQGIIADIKEFVIGYFYDYPCAEDILLEVEFLNKIQLWFDLKDDAPLMEYGALQANLFIDAMKNKEERIYNKIRQLLSKLPEKYQQMADINELIEGMLDDDINKTAEELGRNLKNDDDKDLMKDIGLEIKAAIEGLNLTELQAMFVFAYFCIKELQIKYGGYREKLYKKIKIDLDTLGYSSKADEIIKMVKDIKIRMWACNMSRVDYSFLRALELFLGYKEGTIAVKVHSSELKSENDIDIEEMLEIIRSNMAQWRLMDNMKEKVTGGVIVQDITDYGRGYFNWIEILNRSKIEGVRVAFLIDGLTDKQKEKVSSINSTGEVYLIESIDELREELPESDIVYLARQDRIKKHRGKGIKLVESGNAGPVLELTLCLALLGSNDTEEVCRDFIKKLINKKLLPYQDIDELIDEISILGFVRLPKIEKVLGMWNELEKGISYLNVWA
jgi:hypothetical protein